MAFGFTPKFEQDLELNGLDPKHYLALALITAKHLDWKVNYTSKSGFITFIGGGIFQTMEEFKVHINNDKVFIISKTRTNGMFDWGRIKAMLTSLLIPSQKSRQPCLNRNLMKSLLN